MRSGVENISVDIAVIVVMTDHRARPLGEMNVAAVLSVIFHRLVLVSAST